MSWFDDIQKATFNATLHVFGDMAVWVSSATGEEHKSLVHFKNPDDPYKIGEDNQYEYRPADYSFEYYEDKFPRLKASVDSGGQERVSVKGLNLAISTVVSKFDGKTLVAWGEREDE